MNNFSTSTWKPCRHKGFIIKVWIFKRFICSECGGVMTLKEWEKYKSNWKIYDTLRAN